MIGLDTNIIVRYVAQDDKVQSLKATEIIEGFTADRAGYIGLVTIVELVWVLTSCYKATRGEICDVLETLLRTKELMVENADIVWKALRMFKDSKADFADCLIERTAFEAGCEYIITFDKGAAKSCGMKLID